MSHTEFLHTHLFKPDRLKPKGLIISGDEVKMKVAERYLGIAQVLADPVLVQNTFINRVMQYHNAGIASGEIEMRIEEALPFAILPSYSNENNRGGVMVSSNLNASFAADPFRRLLEMVSTASCLRDGQMHGFQYDKIFQRAEVLSAEVISYFMDLYQRVSGMPIVLGDPQMIRIFEKYPNGVASGLLDQSVDIGDPIDYL